MGVSAKLVNQYINKSQRFNKTGEHVFITSFPKSASTFITKVIAHITGFDHCMYTYGKGRSEQELYFPFFVKRLNKNTVSHQHTRYSEANFELLSKFNYKPIVLVRNIYDCMISLRDHILKEEHQWPMAYIDKHRFYAWTEKEQFDFLIDFAAPWFFNFYCGWVEASEKYPQEVLFVSYKEFLEDKHNVIKKILEHSTNSSNFEIELIKDSISEFETEKKKETRFNIGVRNRGRSSLSSEQISKINSYMKYYDNIDFKLITE